MCACGKAKTNAVTSVQGANAIVAAGQDMPADEIRKINQVKAQQSVNNAVSNTSS